MQEIIHKIDLNLSQPNRFEYIHAMQGDYNAEKVIATLYDRNKLYTIDIDCDTIILQGITESGNLILVADIEICEDRHSVSFTLTKEMLSESGDIKFYLSLLDNSSKKKKSTFPWIIKNHKEVSSSVPVSVLKAITDYVVEVQEYYEKLTSEKGQANGIAVLDKNTKVPLDELYEATTTSKGITQLTDSVTSTSTTTAATPNSVKSINDSLSNHNTSTEAHSDIRDLISGLATRLNTLADSDDTTLDQLSEIVSYIKSNRTLIENVTTNKVNVSDIIDNLTSTVTNKPLSAKQGKVLNDLISSLTSVVNTKIDTINGDIYIGTSKSETTGTITHKDVTRTNTTSTVSPSHGGTFTSVKTVTSDAKGHVTGVDTETVTLPTYKAGDNISFTSNTDNDEITISSAHPFISKSTDTTSTASPSAGGTFTAIDSVARDGNGHVTKVNTKTITLPNTAVVVDSELSETSTNPVQNKVIYEEKLERMAQNWAGYVAEAYIIGIGEPDSSTSTSKHYLDVESGKTYIYGGTTYGWTYASTLLSVNDTLNNKVDKSSIANNLVTTKEGYALDARQGKALDDKITALNNSLDNINEQLTTVARWDNLDAFVGTNAGYFIINGSNTPSVAQKHGFLFCKYYNGSSFAPNGNGAEPITKQVYMPYSDNSMFIRTYNHNTKIWTAWTEH